MNNLSKFTSYSNRRAILLFICCFSLHLNKISSQKKWEFTNSPIGFVSFLYPVKKDLYAGIVGHGIYRTSDLGETWEKVDSGITSLAPTALIKYDKFLIASTFSKGVFRSSDDGKSWVTINEGLNSLQTLCLAENKNILLVGTGDGIYMSPNAGKSWEKALLPAPIGVSNAIYSLFSKGTLIIAGSNRSILVSEDAGKTWNQFPVGTIYDINTITSIGENILLGSSGDKVFESVDFKNWTKKFIAPDEPTNVSILLHDSTGLHVGGNVKGIFKGDTIFDQNLTNERARSIAVLDKNLFIGTFGSGVYKYSLKNSLEERTELDLLGLRSQSTFFGLEAFPNPNKVNTEITLKFWQEEEQNIVIQFFHSNGALIKELINENYPSGVFQIKLANSTYLPVGTYYFFAKFGEHNLVKKLIITD